MEYPKTPFSSTFDRNILTSLPGQTSQVSELELEKLEQWLCSCPKLSSYRVNTLHHDAQTVLEKIETVIEGSVLVELHPVIPEVIIVHRNKASRFMNRCANEVIVDSSCASAVLRGADIFAPGVIGMNGGTGTEVVSIYADLSGKCLKGFKATYENEKKLFIGNGLVKMTRPQLFGETISPSGVAVKLIESISGCRSLKDGFLPPGSVLLQNLPSISCVLALDPKPGESVLDMCASPGNKTTHIAELMKNTGTLIAVDKTKNKIAQLKDTCEIFHAKAWTFVADSTKILCDDPTVLRDLTDGPPFRPDSFDRILLDAPCSGLGRRPLLVNKMSVNEIRSYAPLQKKLFRTAIGLLKPNGILTYSTCTVTLLENEAIVAWALRNHKDLRLVEPAIKVGGPGWEGAGLNEEERLLVQRFGPDTNVDSVGFFFACFTKRETVL